MNILTTVLYPLCWIIIFGLTLIAGAICLQYVVLKPKSTKAHIGIVAIGILWLAAVIGVVIVQAHSLNPTKNGVIYLLVFDSFLIQLIYQWTIAKVYHRIQYVSRWVVTSVAIVYGFSLIGYFIFVRS